MRKKVIFITAAASAILLISLCACSSGGQPELPSALTDDSSLPDEPPVEDSGSPAPGEVVVTFDFKRQSGSASNQYAIWVEDTNGNYINTIFATKWTAEGGFKNRPDAVAAWVEKSDIPSMPDYYVDAVSGATPRASGSLSYAWNLRDINGDKVSPGEYKILVEGTLRWKNHVLFTGEITIGDAPVTIRADAEYFYEASDRQAALTGDSSENAMIGAVTVSFEPAAEN